MNEPRPQPHPELRTAWDDTAGDIRNSCSGRTSYYCCCFHIGQYVMIGCGIFIYLYLLLGKVSFVSLHIYQPLISSISSFIIHNETYQHDKATVPLFTIVVPMLIAGMIASICHIIVVVNNMTYGCDHPRN